MNEQYVHDFGLEFQDNMLTIFTKKLSNIVKKDILYTLTL